jgi:protease-4
VKRGTSADAGEGFRLPLLGVSVPDRPLTESERQRIEKLIRASYEEFVGKVARGRGLDEKYVDSIGQGRVWSGTRGKQNGLVDEIGGLWRSLQIAKAAAGIAPTREIEFWRSDRSIDWSLRAAAARSFRE